MTDSELIVQRFIDQELTPEECVRFVTRLGKDAALREHVIDLEQLVVDTGQLPRPVVPHNFVARVMERTAPRASIWQTLSDMLWAPRGLEWNLVTAATAALILLAAGGIMTRRLPSATTQTAASVPQQATPSTVGASSPVLVRLVIVQPGAKSVHVAGDFNGWDPVRTPLVPASSGAWSIMLPLQPGRYHYMFVVDGQQWIVDPFAVEQNDDGFGSRNAVLEVAGAPL